MSERKSADLPFASEDPAEQKLWAALDDLPRAAPSSDMRHGFYRELENASNTTFATRVRNWLGISGSAGVITATACVLVGVFVGMLLNRGESTEPMRLEVLEQNVALLNRELILDRLQDVSASKRLRGVIDAGEVVQEDAEVARALLVRATEDRVQSVRSAAINVLGPALSSNSAGAELIKLLEDAESPIVQLALVDLVLRNGSDQMGWESYIQEIIIGSVIILAVGLDKFRQRTA
jgi:hypothetical protein